MWLPDAPGIASQYWLIEPTVGDPLQGAPAWLARAGGAAIATATVANKLIPTVRSIGGERC